MTDHRPMRRGDKWFCQVCSSKWPCRAKQEEIAKRVSEASDIPCREWPGHISKPAPGVRPRHGYGRVRIGHGSNRKWMSAHRFVWITTHGPIADDLCVLHTCDNRACVELAHLFTGTRSDNAIDRDAKRRGQHSRKSHCPRGHPYDIVKKSGDRWCRRCHTAYQVVWRREKNKRLAEAMTKK